MVSPSKNFMILFHPYCRLKRFFYKKRFYKQHQAEIGEKNKQMLSNTLRLNVCYLKIILIFHSCYHSKLIGYYSKI